MRKVFCGTSIAAACLLGLVASGFTVPRSALAAEAQISQTIGLTDDRAGIRLNYFPSAGEPSPSAKKASDLLTQALGAYNRDISNDLQADLTFTIAVKPNRELEFTVRASDSSSSVGIGNQKSGDQVNAGLDPPQMHEPPPPYPATSNQTTDVVFRQIENGYQRDTQYHRTPGRAPNWQPGPWRMVNDTTTWVGGGSGGGGGGGGGGTVIVHPPITEEDAN